MEQFKLVSDYQPTGDQPGAIESLVLCGDDGPEGQGLRGRPGAR